MSVLLMSFIGLVGTFAWAGSAREDTVDRLQKSVDVLHAIMSTPDKGIPEEVLSNAKCILVVPDLIKGVRGNGLEDEHSDADLLALQGVVRRHHTRRCGSPAR